VPPVNRASLRLPSSGQTEPDDAVVVAIKYPSNQAVLRGPG